MITMCDSMTVFLVTSLVLTNTSGARHDDYVRDINGRNRIHVRQRIVLSNGNRNLDQVDGWYKSYLKSVTWFNPNVVGWEHTESDGEKNRRLVLPRRIEKYTTNDSVSKREESVQSVEHVDGRPSRSSAEDNEIISGQTEKPRFFRPVGTHWKVQQCVRFNFNCNVGAMVSKGTPRPTALTTPTRLHDVLADGNCWYRCLSTWIDGTEVYHDVLRSRVYKFMLEDQRVRDFVGDVDEYLEKNPMNTLGTWSTEVDIFASAVALNTCIYVYSDTYKSWQLFGKNGDFADHVDPEEECLYMAHVNGNHFQVVDRVQE